MTRRRARLDRPARDMPTPAPERSKEEIIADVLRKLDEYATANGVTPRTPWSETPPDVRRDLSLDPCNAQRTSGCLRTGCDASPTNGA